MMNSVALVTSWVRPSTSTSTGVAQLICTVRFVRQASLPVASVVGDQRPTRSPLSSSRWMMTQVLVEDRRRAGAEPERRELLDRLPERLAVEVVRIQPLRTEVGVDPAGRRSPPSGRQRAAPMPCVVDRSLVGDVLPERLAGLGVERQHLERVLPIGRRRCRDGRMACPPRMWSTAFAPGMHLALDRPRSERGGRPRRSATSGRGGEGGLPERCCGPAAIRSAAPFGRDPLSARSAPLRPVLGGHSAGAPTHARPTTNSIRPTTKHERSSGVTSRL